MSDMTPPPEVPPVTEDQEDKKTQAPAGTPLKSPPAFTFNAPSAESLWDEFAVAINYLTRLHIKVETQTKPRVIRRSMRWFPVVGAAIGFFGASVDWIMTQIGLPGIITAAFAVISMLWITRALHEEEFACLANRYGQAFDGEKDGIGWLKEERSVQYGTLAVILVIIMKIGTLASFADNSVVFSGLIASSSWSRAMMVVLASWLRPISGDPVADYFQKTSTLHMIIALVLGAFLTYLALDTDASYVLGVGICAGILVTLVGAHHLRGYNGPLMGTLQEIVDLAMLGTILVIQ